MPVLSRRTNIASITLDLVEATPFAGRQEKERQATQKNYNDAQKQQMEQRQAPHQTALRALNAS
ncbi:MAG: hypothetical protein WCB11_19890 [Terriglobales bacterium]|jgi:hypothetical protein